MIVFNYLIHTNSLGYLGWDARQNPAEECRRDVSANRRILSA